MWFDDIKNPLIVIVGPTAVGKSDIAFELARRWGAEIVSADSRLLYRGMDIGTAKPTKTQCKVVKHHLIDVANPDEIWSMALFQQKAGRVIKNIQNRGKLPILVGGTGQYIKSITEGWIIPPQLPDLRLRKVLTAWGNDIGSPTLHAKLKILDADAAKKIDPNNLRRIVRALEVILHSGKLFSEQRQKSNPPYSLMIIGINRPRGELYQMIDQRIENMIRMGFVNEVNSLLEKGYSEELPTMSAIGYREIIDYLHKRITLEDAIVLIKRKTREFVRRQANWFKENDTQIHWFTVDESITDRIESLINDRTNWLLPEE